MKDIRNKMLNSSEHIDTTDGNVYYYSDYFTLFDEVDECIDKIKDPFTDENSIYVKMSTDTTCIININDDHANTKSNHQYNESLSTIAEISKEFNYNEEVSDYLKRVS